MCRHHPRASKSNQLLKELCLYQHSMCLKRKLLDLQVKECVQRFLKELQLDYLVRCWTTVVHFCSIARCSAFVINCSLQITSIGHYPYIGHDISIFHAGLCSNPLVGFSLTSAWCFQIYLHVIRWAEPLVSPFAIVTVKDICVFVVWLQALCLYMWQKYPNTIVKPWLYWCFCLEHSEIQFCLLWYRSLQAVPEWVQGSCAETPIQGTFLTRHLNKGLEASYSKG